MCCFWLFVDFCCQAANLLISFTDDEMHSAECAASRNQAYYTVNNGLDHDMTSLRVLLASHKQHYIVHHGYNLIQNAIRLKREVFVLYLSASTTRCNSIKSPKRIASQ